MPKKIFLFQVGERASKLKIGGRLVIEDKENGKNRAEKSFRKMQKN